MTLPADIPLELWDVVATCVAVHTFHQKLTQVHSELLSKVPDADPEDRWYGYFILKHTPGRPHWHSRDQRKEWSRPTFIFTEYQWGNWSPDIRSLRCYAVQCGSEPPILNHMIYGPWGDDEVCKFHPCKEVSWQGPLARRW